jgi:hypothetical protein
LIAWLDGELPFLARTHVDREVRDCRECRSRVADLETTIRLIRQEVLGAGPDERMEIARARWRFRERARELESGLTFRKRYRVPLFAGVAAVAVAVALAFLQHAGVRSKPVPRVDARRVLLGVRSAENANFESAVREEHFEVEIGGGQSGPLVRRQWKVWSAPGRSAYAMRGRDVSGALHFALFASRAGQKLLYHPETGLRPMHESRHAVALYQAISGAGPDVDSVEAAFWKWVRGQTWKPVSLAGEVADFSSEGGVKLAVAGTTGGLVLRAERTTGGGQMSMTLAIGSDQRPRWVEVSWHIAGEQRTMRISREDRVDYADFITAAAYFRPERSLTDVPGRVSRPRVVIAAAEVPTSSELPVAEVQAMAVLHRLGLCVTDELQIVRTSNRIQVSGVVTSETLRSQLLALFNGIPAQSLINFRLQTVADVPTGTVLLPAAWTNRPNSGPAPGENWLRAYLRVGGAATERDLFDVMNRIVRGAEELSTHGWALRRLAERFPPESEKELPQAEQVLLESMAQDHAGAIQSSTALLRKVLGHAGEPTETVEIRQPAKPWQHVAFALGTAADHARNTLLTLFAASEKPAPNLDAGGVGAALDETERNLSSLGEAAGELRRDRLNARK